MLHGQLHTNKEINTRSSEVLRNNMNTLYTPTFSCSQHTMTARDDVQALLLHSITASSSVLSCTAEQRSCPNFAVFSHFSHFPSAAHNGNNGLNPSSCLLFTYFFISYLITSISLHKVLVNSCNAVCYSFMYPFLSTFKRKQ